MGAYRWGCLYWRTLRHGIGQRTSPENIKAISPRPFEQIAAFKDAKPYEASTEAILDRTNTINKVYKLFITRGGGLVSHRPPTNVGDIVCILLGAQVPCILRN